MSEKILEIRNIRKQYTGVLALDDISFDINKGVCHCIIGENGAGKSTLIKILTGALQRTSGNIFLDGKAFNPHSTKEARKAGIGFLFQELNIVNTLTVEQNLTLGEEDTKFGIIRKSNTNSRAYEILKSVDPTINFKGRVEDLSFAKKQIVEIVKALATDARVVIMDEPTAAISEEEVAKLFKLIRELKGRGVTVIYISHRLDELFQIGDFATVLRDGNVIGTKAIPEISSRNELIKMMLGKVIVENYIPNKIELKNKVLQVQNISNSKLRNITFDLYQGEILGFYGLVGAGKSEIARAIYGVDNSSGQISVHGRAKRIHAPFMAIREGIALIPEERRVEGLCTELRISENIPMMNYKSILMNGITSRKKEKRLATEYIEKVGIVCHSENQTTALLSGGNQQKVVFAKCLNAKATILLLDEPTRGVDVGAKQEIYAMIRKQSAQGNSIIVFSSELPEILNLCDRIILLYEGEIRATLNNGAEIDSENIMRIATGGE
jgi:ribose transport system ATP-binding protein